MPWEIDWINAIASAFDLFIAGLIVAESRRLHLGVPRIGVLLILFFVLQAAHRQVSPHSSFGYSPLVDIICDVALIAVLGALLLNARTLTRGLLAAMGEAQYRAQEYERARHDYTQVVRHRILNPVTVVRAAAETLESGTIDDPELRRQLARVIIDASHELESVSLAPEDRRPEEHDLDPVPQIDPDGSVSTPGT